MLEEPAMVKPLSYSSEFVSIRQFLCFQLITQSFRQKNIRAGSPDIFMSMSGPHAETKIVTMLEHFALVLLPVKIDEKVFWFLFSFE